MPGKSNQKFYYAVHRGKQTGVFTDWNSCKSQVHGVGNSRYKKFTTKAAAQAFVKTGAASASTSSSSSSSYSSSSSSSSSSSVSISSLESRLMSAGKRSFAAMSSSSSITGSATNKRARKMSKKAARLEEAAEMIASLPSNAIKVFTDGACVGNPGPSGAGAYFQFPGGVEVKRSKFLGHGTNNIGELTAIRMAIKEVQQPKHSSTHGTAPVHIFTDSKYVHGVVDQGWNAKENVELIGKIKKDLRAARTTRAVNIHWVPAHSGLEGNEVADRLAALAAQTGKGDDTHQD